MFATQIRTGPSYPVPATDDYEDSLYDSSDDEDQPIHPLALAGAKSRKKAYNVYWGHNILLFCYLHSNLVLLHLQQWGMADVDYVVWLQLESLPM